MKKTLTGLATACTLASALLFAGCDAGDSASLPPQPDGRPVTFFTPFTAADNVGDTVAAFRAAVGDTNNGNGAATNSGRREVNWDAVPGPPADTNGFPGDTFVGRGLLLSTNTGGMRVSTQLFTDVNPAYAGQFAAFSNPETFAPIGTNIVDVQFSRAGSQDVAATNGFGVVFSDVDTDNATSIEVFDNTGTSLGKVFAPKSSTPGGFSFAGAAMKDGARCAFVRITCGSGSVALTALDLSNGGTTDLVIMDDFIYGEPQPIAFRVTKGAGVVGTAAAVNRFRVGLGNPNNAVGAGAAQGRREINWDGVGIVNGVDLRNNDTFPGNFFAVNSTRGVVFGTPGTGLRVSSQNFNDVDTTYINEFNNFTSNNTFAPIGSPVVTADFFIPQTNTPGTVSGFGAVFSDVEQAGASFIEFFDGASQGLGTFQVPRRNDSIGLSFLGVQFAPDHTVGSVRVTAGTASVGTGVLDLSDGGDQDLVIMDDFLYGEPR